MTPVTFEYERENDGRWIAENHGIPGCVAYGRTKEEAEAKAKSIAIGAMYPSDIEILALAIYREARGEPQLARVAVGSVIVNRARLSPAQGWPKTIRENILKPFQFSSFNTGDPNSDLFPDTSDPVYHGCINAAMACGLTDPTFGSVFYHDASLTHAPLTWGSVYRTTTIGRLTFYKLPA